ncbi:MAG TPA: hypothetical protein VEF34_13575 [Syntrophobacteraceae bacterium]|nr:hypothetical protein [Syntrophobacteraceae bacterium]
MCDPENGPLTATVFDGRQIISGMASIPKPLSEHSGGGWIDQLYETSLTFPLGNLTRAIPLSFLQRPDPGLAPDLAASALSGRVSLRTTCA